MKETILACRRVCLLTGAWTALASVLAAADFDNNLERTFEVSPGGKLVVQADQGPCEVTTASVDKVHVRVLRRVIGGNQARADELFANHEVAFLQEGKTVSVVAKTKGNLPRLVTPNSPHLQVRYEISIPNRFDADLTTSGADIRVGDLDGVVKARTSSGSIQLPRVAHDIEASNSGGDIIVGTAGGTLKARTSSGSIRVQSVSGSADLSNSGGDIHVAEAWQRLLVKTSSGAIDVKSVNGDLEAINSGGDITVATIGGGVQASTSSGSIKLGLVQGKSARVENSGGSIQIETAEGAVTAKTSSARITINKAQGTVVARNSGGDIELGEVGGQLTANTSSGSINVKLALGNVNARNSGGDIKIEQAKGAIQANTSSGRIAVGLIAAPPGDCRLEVSGGDIRVTAPGSIGLDLDARSSGGKVVSELPVAGTISAGRKPGNLQGRINGGGPKLILRASSGDIELKASNAADRKAERPLN